MLEPASAPGIFQSIVTRHRAVCTEHFELTLSIRGFPAAVPGQFVQLLCHDTPAWTAHSTPDIGRLNEDPLLRRPFSIGGLRTTGDETEIDILARVIGIGTAWLDARREGDKVDLLGPLGTGFTIPPAGSRVLLVAGGVGLPPIRWLGNWLAHAGIETRAILGAQRKDLLPVAVAEDTADTHEFGMHVAEFSNQEIPSLITTDDGSFGIKGRVTEALEHALGADPLDGKLHVFACGPEPMLHAVAMQCQARGVRCQLALERVMGCGMGTCQSCVVPVKDSSAVDGWRFALCCREGPVFDSEALIWTK